MEDEPRRLYIIQSLDELRQFAKTAPLHDVLRAMVYLTYTSAELSEVRSMVATVLADLHEENERDT